MSGERVCEWKWEKVNAKGCEGYGDWEWERRVSGKGVGMEMERGMVRSQVRRASLINLNCENPSALGTHCMHLQGLLFFH